LSASRLPPGEFLCSGKHRQRVKPIRDIVDWGQRRVVDFSADPVEPPEMWADHPETWSKIRHSQPHQSAFWKSLLDCGHFAEVCTDVDWKPEDGPSYPTPERLAEMRAEPVDWDRWNKRLLAAGFPRPAPFQECFICTKVRRLMAYEPVNWVAPRPKPIKPVKPKPVSRETLERRLKKLEAEAAALRKQLKQAD
jgi:hypothetical protein